MIIIKFFKLNRQLLTGKITLSFYWRKIITSILLRAKDFVASKRLFRKIIKRFFPADKVIIRPERPDDRVKIIELINDAPIKDDIKRNIEKTRNVNKYNYVAEYKGKIIGRIGMCKLWERNYGIDEYVISSTYLSKWYRSLGIGEAMHRVLIKHAKGDNLNVIYQTIFNTNQKNLNLAAKLGFRRTDKHFEDMVCGRLQDSKKKMLAFYLDLNKDIE